MRITGSFLILACAIATNACSGHGDEVQMDGGGGSGGNGDTASTDTSDTAIDAGPGDAMPSGGHALTPNDVSVLFPRTGASTASLLWLPRLEGKGGPLIPLATYMRLPRQVIAGEDGGLGFPAAVEYEKMRVVGIRFDPCFGATCQPQVRLVFQAFRADGGVFDGAVHLHYNLTAPEFRALLGELRSLTALATENKAEIPLGPSPALMAQGVNGAYGTALRALVTRYVGAGNLARMTFMARDPASGHTGWQFGGLNLKFYSPEGDLVLAGLPPDSRGQQVQSGGLGLTEYSYHLLPEPVRLRALVPVLAFETAKNASPEARAAASDAVARLENPTIENPDTADCASCHVANRIRGLLEQNHPTTARPDTIYSGLAQARRFVGAAEKDDNNLRAFGYFDSDSGTIQSAAISQRTANETHHVLQTLATM